MLNLLDLCATLHNPNLLSRLERELERDIKFEDFHPDLRDLPPWKGAIIMHSRKRGRPSQCIQWEDLIRKVPDDHIVAMKIIDEMCLTSDDDGV